MSLQPIRDFTNCVLVWTSGQHDHLCSYFFRAKQRDFSRESHDSSGQLFFCAQSSHEILKSNFVSLILQQAFCLSLILSGCLLHWGALFLTCLCVCLDYSSCLQRYSRGNEIALSPVEGRLSHLPPRPSLPDYFPSSLSSEKRNSFVIQHHTTCQEITFGWKAFRRFVCRGL